MTRRLRWLGAGDDLVINAPMELIVRDDAFEVSAANSFARAVGLEYYFSAPETSVEVWRRLPRIYGPGSGKEWILLRSRPAGGGVHLRIGKKDDLRGVWNVLVGTGAVPRSAEPSEPGSDREHKA